MLTALPPKPGGPARRGVGARSAGAVVALLSLAATCHGQGTMTFTFEGQPPGTSSQVGVYYESGMLFGPNGPGSLYLSGGGIPGFAEDGTGYLQAPDGHVAFYFTNTFPTRYFGLTSLDLAGYSTGAPFPSTFQVVGYHPMDGTVTNFFTLTTPLPSFQTFYLDSSFVNLFRVEIFGGSAPFSLDNVLISGVPEPSAAALLGLGAGCVLWRAATRVANGRCRSEKAKCA